MHTLIHPGWLALAFLLGVAAVPIFAFTVLRARPSPSKRQRALFLAMRSAMDETRRITVELGPVEFLPRIDVLRSVPIEQITRSADSARMFLHEALHAIQLLDTCDRTPGGDVQRAWCRTLYAGKDLVLTVLFPAEDEAPGAEPVEERGST